LTGGIIIRRLFLAAVILFLFLFAVACGAVKDTGTNGTAPASVDDENGTVSDMPDIDATPSETGLGTDGEDEGDDKKVSEYDPSAAEEHENDSRREAEGGTGYELLQSASIDLDNDGINEQVEIVKTVLTSWETGTDQVEGRLLISGRDFKRQIVFCRTGGAFPEILTRVEFEDLDADGAKDIFIVIPGYGASFSYSNYFIYSFAKDKGHSFSSDNELADFIDQFEFSSVKGSNLLTVTNQIHGFSADIVIEELTWGETPEDIMQQYAEGTWIDPVSVDISEDSRLALVKKEGTVEIKVPLPVFGMATVNMIAEIDLYYRIDSDFKPVLKRCEIIDFTDDGKIKAGSFEVGNG